MINIEQERATLLAMIHIFCKQQHGETQLCKECTELWHYAEERLAKCPFGIEKPTCQNCTVHCYKPEMRAKIRAVMRYAGPRMLLRHPMLAVFHLIDGFKKAPTL